MAGTIRAFSALVIFPGSNRAVLVFLQALTDAADADAAFAHFLFPYGLASALDPGHGESVGAALESPRDVEVAVNALGRRGHSGLARVGEALAFGPGMLSARWVRRSDCARWAALVDRVYRWGEAMRRVDPDELLGEP